MEATEIKCYTFINYYLYNIFTLLLRTQTFTQINILPTTISPKLTANRFEKGANIQPDEQPVITKQTALKILLLIRRPELPVNVKA